MNVWLHKAMEDINAFDVNSANTGSTTSESYQRLRLTLDVLDENFRAVKMFRQEYPEEYALMRQDSASARMEVDGVREGLLGWGGL